MAYAFPPTDEVMAWLVEERVCSILLYLCTLHFCIDIILLLLMKF